MKITEKVNDRNKIEGAHTDVQIEVDHIGGSSTVALEVTERIADAVREEIKEIAEDQ